MTLFFANLVRVACHGTGAGSLLLGAPLPGHRGFDLVPPGMRFHYAVLGVTHPEEWETGEGESEFGRTRLAEVLVPAWGGVAAWPVEKEGGARAARAGTAAATRP